ncbi:MAG: argininosuccinate lyase, partial [Butyrivibrio sp.]|nr:argininosuccinate lyase [Butyrivibrio sp.]
VKNCVTLYTDMLKTLKFNKENMEKSASKGFTNATDAADYLVNKGMPFRDAHSVIGQLVLYCIDKECAIDDLRLSELKRFSELFEEDIYDAISLKTCVEKRLTIGAPSKEAMMRVITENEALLMGFKLM